MKPVVANRDARALIVVGDDSLPSLVPSARTFTYKGNRLWAVPWETREAQMLRAAGYAAPAPIATFYDWPRDRTILPQPFENQILTAAFLTLSYRGYCLNEIGTGKTMASLWAADYLMKMGLIRKVLVIAPLSTLETVWSDALFVHFNSRPHAVLHGSAEKRKKLFANDRFDFFVINHDGLPIISELEYKQKRAGIDPNTGETIYQKVLVSAKLLRDDIDLIIIDELGPFRNAQTDRWKYLNFILRGPMWAWGMTGTPIPNAPSDAYAQIKMLTPERVPKYYTDFKHMTMQQLSEYIWIPKKEAIQIVYDAMQPAVRFERDQCFDLPPCTHSDRTVELTAAQKKHFKELEKDFFTEVKGGQINVVNEGVKSSKLLQCCGGVIYDNDGEPREIDAKPRIELVREIVGNCEHKVIVFVPFTAPLKMLERELSKDFTCAVVYGGVSKTKRDGIFAAFQKLRDPKVLIADAGCMSHGLTLTSASTIIWYGPEFSNETYEQANGRITRYGQKNNQHVIHISSTAAERALYARLKNRQATQGALLALVKKGTGLL